MRAVSVGVERAVDVREAPRGAELWRSGGGRGGYEVFDAHRERAGPCEKGWGELAGDDERGWNGGEGLRGGPRM